MLEVLPFSLESHFCGPTEIFGTQAKLSWVYNLRLMTQVSSIIVPHILSFHTYS